MIAPLLALTFALHAPAATDRASTLYSQCRAYTALVDNARPMNSDAMLDAGTCVGYIDGFTDVVAAGSTTVCLQPTTIATLARVYIAYMDAHPKAFDVRRGVSLALALTDAYPCPAK